MTTVKITGRAVVTRNVGEAAEKQVAFTKVWPAHDVMRLSICRGWVTRQFNHLRKSLGPNDSVRATYQGQLAAHPFTMYGGGLRGTTRIRCAEGDME